MTKPKNSVMSNAKGCVMDNLEDLHNFLNSDIDSLPEICKEYQNESGTEG